MPFVLSTVNKVLLGIVLLLLVASVSFGGVSYYRGTVIDKQDKEIATQKEALANFEKDRAAQDVADKQLTAEKDRIAKERDSFKAQLKNALKDNVCANTALPDDAQRMLKELYGSQRP